MTHYIGVDLAWGEGTAAKPAKETGVVCLDSGGGIHDAGWTRGIDATAEWIVAHAGPGDVVAIDAPLIVTNPTGMRECEREVGSRYGRWKVAANASNLSRAWLGGVTLRARLEAHGFEYADGIRSNSANATTFFECYPYTALVGAEEFGYEVERPRYKRPVPGLSPAARREYRARECDELIRRFAQFGEHTPPIRLDSNAVTAELLNPSPLVDAAYKHREDLLDAAICAWTAALWHTRGLERCQLLGADSAPDAAGNRAVIIAPARAEQRR